MNDQQYISAIEELQAIYEKIAAVGALAAIQYKGTLQRQVPVVLAEAKRRATDGR